MSKDKEAAKEALAGLREMLLADPEGLAYLDTLERYIGELRRNLATAKTTAEQAEATAAATKQSVVELHRDVVQLATCKEQLAVCKDKCVALERQAAETQDAAAEVVRCVAEERKLLAREYSELAVGLQAAAADAPTAENTDLALAKFAQLRLEGLMPGRHAPRDEGDFTVEARRAQLHRLVPHYFGQLWALHAAGRSVLKIHQDTFASEYHADEYTFMGMLAKMAGETGKTVVFFGRNGEMAVELEKELAKLGHTVRSAPSDVLLSVSRQIRVGQLSRYV